MFKIIVILISMFFINSLLALTVNEIQEAIKMEGKSWTADKNEIWNSKENVIKHLIPNKRSDSVEFTFVPKLFSNNFGIPNKIDWRKYMSSVKNQGSCTSCVAMAAVAAFEGQLNIVSGLPGFNINLSEQYLWSCGGPKKCTVGWSVGKGAKYLTKYGIPDESCLTYSSGATGEPVACSDACQDSKERMHRPYKYRYVNRWYAGDKKLMRALKNGPVMALMYVFEDFMAYKSGVYEHVTGKMMGGHAVTLVGYNKSEKYWIVKNSWGPNWGDKGYFKIRMGDPSHIGPDTVRFVVKSLGGVVELTDPKFGEYVRGNKLIRIVSTYKDTVDLGFWLEHNGNKLINEQSGTKGYAVEVDTKNFDDGIYDITAIAKVKIKKKTVEVKSIPRRFYILNSKPVLSAKLTSPKAGATVSGMAKINFELESTPVPLQKMTIFTRAKNGEIKKSYYESPAKKTVILWNTKRRENGEYEIWGEASINNYRAVTRTIKVTIKN